MPDPTPTPNPNAPPSLPPEACDLERHLPHLMKKICLLWGDRDFEPFAANLIMDSRDGKRQGLPWGAAQEILFLTELVVAKRAVVAASMTGQPFRQVFRHMQANAEAAAGMAPVNRTAQWNDPMANAEREKERRDGPALGGRGGKRPAKAKKGWLAKLFGG